MKTPDFFPIMSLLPQRALCSVKEKHPTLFVSAFLDIFEAMWKNGKDVSVPETLAETLQTRFSSEETREILSSANSPPFKQRLNDNTKEALDKGAFGAPWFWVRNARGAEEPFFGSDRYANPISFHTYCGSIRSRYGVGASGRGKRVRRCELGSHGRSRTGVKILKWVGR